MTRRAALLATCIVLAASSAAADDRVRVAIVPGVAVNMDAARVDALSQELADALKAELVVEAVGGLEVRRRLPAEGVPPDCLAQPTCVTDVSRRLDVNQLLFVVMVDAGGAVQIDTTWVDAATAKSVSRPAIDIAVLAEAKSRFTAAATSLLPDAPVRPKAKPVIGIKGEMTAVPRHFTRTSYITAGLAVVGLGVGVGFGLYARSQYDDCDQPMAPCAGTDKEDSIRRNALIADLGYVTALGASIATVVLYMTSGSESRVIVSPESNAGAAVTVVGRF